jgi:hypothetical protein
MSIELLGGDGEYIGPFDKLRASPSARKERGPQDDKSGSGRSQRTMSRE